MKAQPILMLGTIFAWACGIYSIWLMRPIWQHIGAYLVHAMGVE